MNIQEQIHVKINQVKNFFHRVAETQSGIKTDDEAEVKPLDQNPVWLNENSDVTYSTTENSPLANGAPKADSKGIDSFKEEDPKVNLGGFVHNKFTDLDLNEDG